MRVALGSIDIDDRTRRAINNQMGRAGLASRKTVRTLYRAAGDEWLEDVVDDYERSREEAVHEEG